MLKLLFTLLILCTLAKAETSPSYPSYEQLSHPTESNETRGQASSQISTSEFLAVTQSYQQLEGLFNGILLFSQNGVSEALPKASEQFLKLLSQQATASLSGLPDSENPLLSQFYQKIEKLGTGDLLWEELQLEFFQLKSLVFRLGEELKQNIPHLAQPVLDESSLQAAMLLMLDLNSGDFSNNRSGLVKMFSDLGELLQINSHPMKTVFYSALLDLQNTNGNSGFQRQKLIILTQKILNERDGR